MKKTSIVLVGILTGLFISTSAHAKTANFDLSTVYKKRFEENCGHKNFFDSLTKLEKNILKHENNEDMSGFENFYKLINVTYRGVPVKAIETSGGRTSLTQTMIFDANNKTVKKSFKALPFKAYDNRSSSLSIDKVKKEIQVTCLWSYDRFAD